MSVEDTVEAGSVVIVRAQAPEDAESIKVLHEYVNGMPGREDREPISVAEAILFGVRMTAQALRSGRAV